MDLPIAAMGAAAAAGVASSAHCAAMCGPLVLAVCGAPGREGLRAGARYGLGRLVSYAVTGSIAGALGSRLVRVLRGEHMQQAVSIALGLGLALAAVRLLRARGSNGLVQLKPRRDSKRLPALLTGLATGFLPCGALAAGLMIAAGAASWWGGALAMTSFAIASAPALAGVVVAGATLGDRMRSMVTPGRRKVLGVAMALAALWVAARPWFMPEQRCHCHAAITQAASARPST